MQQMILSSFLALGALSALVTAVPGRAGSVALRTEHLAEPMGLETRHPRLSWEMVSDERDEVQTAYQVLVATSKQALGENKGDLWDSGKVVSDSTFDISYGGKPLHSHQQCFWKVRVWDRKGRSTQWSAPASWSMGLLSPSDWGTSQWIGYDSARPAKPDSQGELLPPPVYLRTGFSSDMKPKRATLYATALGWFEAHINGKRINDTFFDPGWTDYSRRVYYRAYDVTASVRQGANVLGAVLADGWFSGYIGWAHERDHYGPHPRFRALLHLEYADGSTRDVVTGSDWKASVGPIQYADILQGESYDARKELANWDSPLGKAEGWAEVAVGADVAPALQPHPGPPVRIIQEFRPETVTEPKAGVYILNLGQNFAGVARLKVQGNPGQKITLRYGERLDAQGDLYTANLRSARATDTYICKGGGIEEWMPRFTFHGFQYVEITGLTGKPAKDTCVGVAVSTDNSVAGEFDTDDPMLNRLHSNIEWTQRANFIDIPTDCPQRDERLGWTGDAQIYIRTATLNADAQGFYTKWLIDLDDAQRADGRSPQGSGRRCRTGLVRRWRDLSLDDL
jgi:alpha-L-rhamnosidase